jgi:hypothetical protein
MGHCGLVSGDASYVFVGVTHGVGLYLLSIALQRAFALGWCNSSFAFGVGFFFFLGRLADSECPELARGWGRAYQPYALAY